MQLQADDLADRIESRANAERTGGELVRADRTADDEGRSELNCDETDWQATEGGQIHSAPTIHRNSTTKQNRRDLKSTAIS